MVSGINNIQPSSFQPQISPSQISVDPSATKSFEPLNSFADEDEAIISSEAKLLSELDKFNSGKGDAVNLAVTGEMTKFTVGAEVDVVNAKKDMIDSVLEMGK